MLLSAADLVYFFSEIKVCIHVIPFIVLTVLKFVLQALPVSVCLFIMYRLLYSSIVSRFG